MKQLVGIGDSRELSRACLLDDLCASLRKGMVLQEITKETTYYPHGSAVFTDHSIPVWQAELQRDIQWHIT